MTLKRFISSISLTALLLTSLAPGAMAEDTLPNLKVDSIELEDDVLTIKIKNDSDVSVAANTEGVTSITIDNAQTPDWTYAWSTLSDQGFLNAQGTGVIQPQVLTEGTHTVKVCVDTTETVAESDETDNCSEVTLVVESETETPSLPDLTIDNISLENNETLTIEMKNESDVAVTTTSGHTYIYINDMTDPAWTYSWSTLSDQSFLSAQGNSDIQPQTLGEGTHAIKACIDANNVVEESDENNNCMEVYLVIEEESEEETTETEEETDNSSETQTETEVDTDDLGEEFEEEWNRTLLPSTYFVSVTWGDFNPDNNESMKEAGTTTTWNGDVSFEGDLIGRPERLLGFEKNEDELNLSETSPKNTSFDSVIHWAHDGILFKVKADMEGDETPTLVFETEHSTTGVEVTIQELLDSVNSGEVYTYDYGDGYQVIINIMPVQDWVKQFKNSVLVHARIGNLDGNGSETDETKHYNVEITPTSESVVKKAVGIMLETHEGTTYDSVEWDEGAAALESLIDGHQDGVLTWIKKVNPDTETRAITVKVTDMDSGSTVFEKTFTRDDAFGTFALEDGSGNQIEIKNLFRNKEMNDEDAEKFFDETAEKYESIDENAAGEVLGQIQEGTKVMGDVEVGAWYENYASQAIEHGFFSGYKDEQGNATGNIGPADNITRLQLIKVMFELSKKLEMGIGAEGCDPETVELTSEVEWMESDWATGYVQCVYNSDSELTLLTDVIGTSLDDARRPAFRWEVVMTAFEMLDVATGDYEDYELSDLEGSALQTDVKNMIQSAIDQGIISGYEDKSFKPFRWVNRAEMFKIVNLFYEVYS